MYAVEVLLRPTQPAPSTCLLQFPTPCLPFVAGALRDNNRARIIGDTHTFGKGRIQVWEREQAMHPVVGKGAGN